MEYHRPVLYEESLELLNVQPGGIYVDCTFGGGGHSKGILERIGSGKLLAFDRDADAHHNLIEDERLELIRSDFKFIESELEQRGIEEVDGILADLGVSSHHLDTPERGFSFRFGARLDMRMDQDQELTAVEVVNEYPEKELAEIFWKYGELRNSRSLAAAICTKRALSRIETTEELETAIEKHLPQKIRKKMLSMVYQALRIEVNGEMEGLSTLLRSALTKLKSGGSMVIISYHSLEDRMVKNFFRYGNHERKDNRDFYGRPLNPLAPMTKRAMVPSEQEILENPRARSAKMRAAKRL